jgi:ribonuclease T1
LVQEKMISMLRGGRQRWLKACAAIWMALCLSFAALSPGLGYAKGPQENLVGTVEIAQLPPQGRAMMTLIYQGGPFRYDKDGSVFGNRERILPPGKRGYYREYTVSAPGMHGRGPRRIICGGLRPAAPETCYYTDDHYASFRRIVQQAE